MEIGAVVDAGEDKMSQRDMLLNLADDAEVWRSPDGDTFATIDVDGHREHHATKGHGFKDWLLTGIASRFTIKGRPASATNSALNDALVNIEARARVTGRVSPTPLRVAEHDNCIYIDMGDPAWRTIKVAASGWEILDRAPVPIIRSAKTAALPSPGEGAGLEPLRRSLPHISDTDFVLYVSWILAALWPRGPYPVLILGGEQGTGKSTVARIARRYCDPTTGDLLQPPRDDRDLIAAAKNNHVLAFDNISRLSPELADAICRLSTKGELGGRRFFTNDDQATFTAERPVILNGIPDLATRGDLASRSIVLRLQPLQKRITVTDLWAAVEQSAPAAFSALLDGLSMALRRLSDIPTPNIRMADFARLAAAAEPGFGWSPGTVLNALHINAASATATLIEGDLVASAIQGLIESSGGEWRGLVSELHKTLTDRLPDSTRRNGDWPANARWFSDRLTRAAAPLRQIGIDIRTKPTARGTGVDIKNGDLAPLAPLAPSTEVATAAPNGASGANGANSLFHNEGGADGKLQAEPARAVGWTGRL